MSVEMYNLEGGRSIMTHMTMTTTTRPDIPSQWEARFQHSSRF